MELVQQQPGLKRWSLAPAVYAVQCEPISPAALPLRPHPRSPVYGRNVSLVFLLYHRLLHRRSYPNQHPLPRNRRSAGWHPEICLKHSVLYSPIFSPVAFGQTAVQNARGHSSWKGFLLSFTVIPFAKDSGSNPY